MNFPRLHRFFVLALPCVVLPVAACSSSPETTGGPGASVATAGDTEAGRVQSFLDARYKTTDVRYSFHTRAGQDIDCVDFFAEPGVKAMAARGQPITSIPKPPSLPDSAKRAVSPGPHPEDDLAFHGQLDVDGKPMQCPEGSVAEVRISADEIAAAGGLDEYVRGRGHKNPPPGIGVPGDYPTYGHVTGTLTSTAPGIQFGSTTMAVYGPNIPSNWGDHSLSQLWLYSGSNTAVTGGTCTSNCVKSIEVGWDVDNAINSGDKNTPHIFLFSTDDGYAKTGCYNNVPNEPYACVPWVPSPSAAFALNQALSFDPPANTGGQDPQAAPTEMSATVIEIGGNFWITLQIGSTSSYIGYFPGTDFGGTPMSTFQVGGEVDDQTQSFTGNGEQMGSGYPPTAGYGWAAYHRDYAAAWQVSGSNVWAYDATMSATRPLDYTYSTAPGPGLSTWGQFFYYGGTACTPTTSCASAGDNCGTISDGCGNTLNCGSTCPSGDTCSANKCVCTPKVCKYPAKWDPSTCSCQVQLVCHTAPQCCAQAGGSWVNGHCE